MPFDYDKFAEDLSREPLGELLKKYGSKLPSTFDTNLTIEMIHAKGIELAFVDRDWNWDDPAIDGYFMIYDGNEYSVFLGERQGQHWLKKFKSYDEALSYKLKLIVNAIGTAK